MPLFGLRPWATNPQREATDPRAGHLVEAEPRPARKRRAARGASASATRDRARTSRAGSTESGRIATTATNWCTSSALLRSPRATPRRPPRSRRRCAARSTRSGSSELYTHQAQAIDHVRAGESVVLVTGTASGKTLAYSVPVVETLAADPERACALPVPDQGAGAGPAQVARAVARCGHGALRGARAAGRVRRRHERRGAAEAQAGGERHPHEPRHAAPGDPAVSREVGAVLPRASSTS